MFGAEETYAIRVWLRNGIYAAPAILFGLLLIWALCSEASWLRSRWYLRVAIPLFACGLLLPTGLHEVMLFALLTLGFVILQIALLRGVLQRLPGRLRRSDANEEASQQQTGFRFGLRDALLATGLFAIVLALGTYAARTAHDIPWQPLLLSAGCYSLVIFTTAIAGFVPVRWVWLQLSLLLIWVPIIIGLCMWWRSIDWLSLGVYDWDIFNIPPASFVESTPFQVPAIAAGGLLIAALAQRFAFARWRRETWSESTAHQGIAIAGRCAAVLILAISLLPCAVAATWLYILLCRPFPQIDQVVIEGNSYVEMSEAVGKLDMVAMPADYDVITREQLATFVARHKKDIEIVDTALDRPCRKVFNFELEPWEIDFPSINGARCYARIQLAEGRFCEADGDYALACQHYMKAVELGSILRNGGLWVDALVGVAIEAMGLEAIRNARHQLPAPAYRMLIQQLYEVDHQQEPWELINERDRAWEIRTGGDSTRLELAIAEMVYRRDYRSFGGETGIAVSDAKRRLLLVDLAIRAFYLEHDRYPSSLDELVGDCLESVPIDPFNDLPLVYALRPDETQGYVLYSVGTNGVDDGGQFVSRYEAVIDGVGDFFLDANDEEESESADEPNAESP